MSICGECKWLDVSAETEDSQDRRKYYEEHPEKLTHEREQRYMLPHYACTAPVPISAAVEWTDDMAMDNPADDCPCFTKR